MTTPLTEARLAELKRYRGRDTDIADLLAALDSERAKVARQAEEIDRLKAATDRWLRRMVCGCGDIMCAGVTDSENHQCGGPEEACGVTGCPECDAALSRARQA